VAGPFSYRALLLADAAAAAVFAGAFLLQHLGDPGRASPTVALLVIAAICLPLPFRRVWPVPVCAVVLTASVAALLLDGLREPFTAAAFALYTVALRPRPRHLGATVAVAAAVTLVFGLIGGTTAPVGDRLGTLLTGIIVLCGAWTLGWAVRERRIYAERAAEQYAAAAVGAERLRIARELHDVVTYSMGLIAVKAGVANHVLAVRPEEAYDALRVIERTSRDALAEMRRMVGVLRTEEAGRPVTLARLAADARAAGVAVDLVVAGADDLPDDVARSVFRIVQESLTNVARHAVPPRCRVAVTATAPEVIIEITDGGARPVRMRAGGHGLIGMRERAAAHGGEFEAGPKEGGGFRVRARLPVEAAHPRAAADAR
jgi:signal transduction histidine kinase